MRILFISIVLGISTLSGYSQTARDVLKKANENFNSLDSYDVSLVYSVYEDDMSNPIEEKTVNIIQIKDQLQYCSFDEFVKISNPKHSILIDKTEKVLDVQESVPIEKVSELNFMQYLTENVKLNTSSEAGLNLVTMLFDEKSEIQKIIVSIDPKTELIVKTVIDFNPDYAQIINKEKMLHLKIELQYNSINKNLDNALFSSSAYFSINSMGMYIPTELYTNYSVNQPK